MLSRIAEDETPPSRYFLMKDLAARHIHFLVDTTLKRLAGNNLGIEKKGIEAQIGSFETVVPGMRVKPCNEFNNPILNDSIVARATNDWGE
jgi:hypothetical protein